MLCAAFALRYQHSLRLYLLLLIFGRSAKKEIQTELVVEGALREIYVLSISLSFYSITQYAEENKFGNFLHCTFKSLLGKNRLQADLKRRNLRAK